MPSNRPEVSVLILNWNNAPDTLECLASVYRSQNISFDVYVIDNGSTDDSLSILKAAYPQAHFLENGANLGYAEGNNRGIAAALQGGAPFLFILNNDAVLREDTLALLHAQALAHPEAAVFGPKIYYYDTPATIWYGGGDWDPYRATFFHLDWNVPEEESTQRTLASTGFVCGCALLIRSSMIRQFGVMDPRFYLIWEEIDWCWRIRRGGFECLFVPQAKCWHKISQSFIGGKRGPMWLYFYWRNRLLWMEKNVPLKTRLSLFAKVLFPQIKTLCKAALHASPMEKKEARASLLGVRDYLLRRFGPCPPHLFQS